MKTKNAIMKTVLELREQRADIVAKMEAIDTKADAENRTLTEEEGKSWDNYEKELTQLDAEIRRAETREKLEAQKAAGRLAAQKRGGEEAEKKAISKNYSFMEAVKRAYHGKPLDGLVREMHEEAEKEVRADTTLSGGITGIGVPSFLVGMEKRDVNVGTTTAGGHTVETNVGQLIPFLQPNLVTVQAGATVLEGLVGNLDLPRNDATITAVWEGENDAGAEVQPTFDKLSLSPNRLGAYTQVSKLLMHQSTIPSVENWIRRELEQSIARKLDITNLQGNSGGSDPYDGILNTSGIGAVYAGNAADDTVNANGANPVWADYVNLFKEVDIDNAAMGALSYVTHPSVVAYNSYSPKQASGVEGNFIQTDRGNLFGFPVFTTTQFTDITKGTSTDLKAIIFGNFAEMILGRWAGLDIVVDPYSSSKNMLVDIVVNGWYDMVIAHAASFAACDDADVSGVSGV